MSITIVPLGTPRTLTIEAWSTIQNAKTLFLQTAQHPSAKPVLDAALSFVAMDDLYTACADFEQLNQAVAKRLVEAEDCVYAICGTAARTQLPAIETAAKQAGIDVVLLPGVSYAMAAFPAHASSGAVFAAAELPAVLDPASPLFIEEVDTPIAAGQLKLALMEYYPDDWAILFASMDPVGGYRIVQMPLYDLDRQKHYHAATVVSVPPISLLQKTRFGYHDLLTVLRRLRAPDGCPWDREQTHASIKTDLLEECYELIDAIERDSDDDMCEEAGDVLMQSVFHAIIGEEQCSFTPRDMTTELVAKLIYRHPHVFGNADAKTSDDVLASWDKLKKAEKHQSTDAETLRSVPKVFPALTRARKVQKRAARVGFDWDSADAAFFKIAEETDELHQAMANGTNVAEEVGDLLFTVVNVARLLALDPEFLLTGATDKFIERFDRMEQLASQNGQALSTMTLQEMDVLWEKTKNMPVLG